MKPPSARFALVALFFAGALAVSYIIIFAFYVAGLFGDGSSVSVETWERTLKATVLLGTPLAAFLVLGVLAWADHWIGGLLPWDAGAIAILILARRDAGIFSWFDLFWIVPLLFGAWYFGHRAEPPPE